MDKLDLMDVAAFALQAAGPAKRVKVLAKRLGLEPPDEYEPPEDVDRSDDPEARTGRTTRRLLDALDIYGHMGHDYDGVVFVSGTLAAADHMRYLFYNCCKYLGWKVPERSKFETFWTVTDYIRRNPKTLVVEDHWWPHLWKQNLRRNLGKRIGS